MVNSTAYVAWINHDDGAGYVVSYYMNGVSLCLTHTSRFARFLNSQRTPLLVAQPSEATTCCPPARR